MTTTMNQTGEQIKYENGRIFNIYCKETKSGTRYYRYSRGRFFPVSKLEINERICLA
tara:strand:- start:417 stop:587 length:171 start_codon:yes stop_codon:yes gene_type:complete